MTVTEIAKRAGVSIGTVDRVLHNRGRVSEETRERIQRIIDESGYQPNALARHLKRNRDYRIGVLIPELDKESRYWKLLYNGILRAVSELSAFSFRPELFQFVRPDRNSLADAFDRMAASNCAAYIIAPVIQEDILVHLNELDNGVPYAFIDTALPGAVPLTTVAQNPRRAGFLAGRLMELLGKTGGTYAVLKPYSEAWNLNERARGFIDWFRGKDGFRLIDLVCSELRMDDAYRMLDDVFRSTDDLKGIFAVSSIGHLIASHVVKRGMKEKISIIGYDLVDENVRLLRDGAIDCLISQRPEEQGRLVIQQIYRKIVLEEEPVQSIEMPFDIYFRENLP